MADRVSLGRRWAGYRPSKGVWFWSCVACVVATMVVGFNWGGWVTGGTATKLAIEAADGARAQLAAADCINRFQSGPDAMAKLAALKHAEAYDRSGLIQKDGWATMPGSKDPVAGAADICAQQLVSAAPPATTTTTHTN